MEVITISTQTIKPSSPTPPHLQKMVLSYLDQKSSPRTIPTILFYRAPLFDKAAPLDIIARLKTGLSNTLTHFYPLAGRYNRTSGTILCNDEGVPFVEAQVNCPISTVISSPTSSNVNLLALFPPGEKLIRFGIHLAIQVNVFTCGGFALGFYHTHKITDGFSIATFFRHWAALGSERYEDAAQCMPDYSSSVTVFPPLPEEDKPLPPESNHSETNENKDDDNNNNYNNNNNNNNSNNNNNKNVVRSFVFKDEAITELKAKSVSDQVPNPSRFEAVSGFLWQQILSFTASPSKEGQSILGVVVDLRSRTDPPMPKGSMGNLLETAFIRAQKQAALPELVSEIRESLTKMKELTIEYQSEKREEAKEKHWKGFIKTYMECNRKHVYLVTSWCKSSGFSNVDFGFGRPVWIVPVDNRVNPINYLRDFITVTEFGDGFEVWLFLEEEHIKFLESNQQFLAFASSNF